MDAKLVEVDQSGEVIVGTSKPSSSTAPLYNRFMLATGKRLQDAGRWFECRGLLAGFAGAAIFSRPHGSAGPTDEERSAAVRKFILLVKSDETSMEAMRRGFKAGEEARNDQKRYERTAEIGRLQGIADEADRVMPVEKDEDCW